MILIHSKIWIFFFQYYKKFYNWRTGSLLVITGTLNKCRIRKVRYEKRESLSFSFYTELRSKFKIRCRIQIFQQNSLKKMQKFSQIMFLDFLRTFVFPLRLKQANITPMFKKWDKKLTENIDQLSYYQIHGKYLNSSYLNKFLNLWKSFLSKQQCGFWND